MMAMNINNKNNYYKYTDNIWQTNKYFLNKLKTSHKNIIPFLSS